MLIDCKKENWIAKLGDTTDWYIVLHNLGHLTPVLVRETVDKVFGEKKMYVIPHGTQIVVHHIDNYNKQQENRGSGLRHSEVKYTW